MDQQVPYLSFSGGEPTLHPLFFEMVAYVCARNSQLKIETNGHGLSVEKCERLKSLGVKAVQVSLDGASRETFNRMRIRGDFDLAIEGIRNLHAAGVPVEINYSPTLFNVHEIGLAVDLAYELGAYSFYTGRTMYTGNAVKTWHRLVPTEEQYAKFFEVLHAKSAEYKGRMRVYFHEMGLLEELRYRLLHPAALLIVLPNGLVKLINALPFVCGDLRRQSLEQVWANFQTAWADPRVRAVRRGSRDRFEQNSRLCTNGYISKQRLHRREAQQTAGYARRLLLILSLVRYRFFLYAGLLPYLLGAAWAHSVVGRFDAPISGADSRGWCSPSSAWKHSMNTSTRAWARIVFSTRTMYPRCRAGCSGSAWPLSQVRWPSVSTFRSAMVGPSSHLLCWAVRQQIFYAAPPIRWAYRGLGEAVIALSYGPWLVLGSLYLHTRAVSWGALWASLVPGLLIMALAVVNAIPDFHQDRLVGKRNLVVRLGRRRAVWLYLALAAAGLLVVLAGVIAGEFPTLCLVALIALPLLVMSGRRAIHTFESPRQFVPAIRSIVSCYMVAVSLFTAAVLVHGW